MVNTCTNFVADVTEKEDDDNGELTLFCNFAI